MIRAGGLVDRKNLECALHVTSHLPVRAQVVSNNEGPRQDSLRSLLAPPEIDHWLKEDAHLVANGSSNTMPLASSHSSWS